MSGQPRSRSKRTAMARLALLCVASLLCLVVVEVLTRVGLMPLPEHPWSSAWWRERWLRNPIQTRAGQTWYPIDTHHPVLGYTMLPNVDGIRYEDSGGVFITSSNSIGARGTREYPREPVPGLTRVVLIGDSFTFGQGVSDHETSAAVLEAEHPEVEAINLAVHGYGHDQMLLRLQLDGLGLEPDVVVLGFVSMDVARNGLDFRDYVKPMFVLRDGRLELIGTPLDAPEEVRDRFRLRSLCYPAMLRDRLLQSRNAVRTETVTRRILDEMVRVTEAAGARVVFLYLPTFAECASGDSTPHEVYLQTCRAHQRIVCVDPTAAIHAFLRGTERPERFFVDHYEPEIHRVIAGQLATVIVDRSSAASDGSE